jgi:hypothetical protein
MDVDAGGALGDRHSDPTGRPPAERRLSVQRRSGAAGRGAPEEAGRGAPEEASEGADRGASEEAGRDDEKGGRDDEDGREVEDGAPDLERGSTIAGADTGSKGTVSASRALRSIRGRDLED